MTSFYLPVSRRSAIWLLAIAGMSVNVLHAEDIVPAQSQSDAQISVWVDDAPLGLFISELALITGRVVSIEGDLQGQVSGRFNGSMVDTLDALSEQFPVLFDLDENSLAAVASTQKSSAIIALTGKSVGQQMNTILPTDYLPGNEVQVREGDVVVSGHPEFVKRISSQITSLVAENEPLFADKVVADIMKADVDDSLNETLGKDATQSTNDIEVPQLVIEEPVVDVAAQVMLDDALDKTPVPDQSESASLKRPFRWVTDIPGYDTF